MAVACAKDGTVSRHASCHSPGRRSIGVEAALCSEKREPAAVALLLLAAPDQVMDTGCQHPRHSFAARLPERYDIRTIGGAPWTQSPERNYDLHAHVVERGGHGARRPIDGL